MYLWRAYDVRWPKQWEEEHFVSEMWRRNNVEILRTGPVIVYNLVLELESNWQSVAASYDPRNAVEQNKDKQRASCFIQKRLKLDVPLVPHRNLRVVFW